jgi:hypothetical protein
MGIGDWGLGIGDWANPQSPIPNPQSPLFCKGKSIFNFKNICTYVIIFKKFIKEIKHILF